MSITVAAPLLAGLAAALYLHAALRCRWPRRRTASFLCGTAVLALAPLIGEGSLAAHMLEHSAAVTVAAPLIVLGAPLSLALRITRGSRRATLLRAIRSRPVEVACHPVTAWTVFVATQWAAHLPGVIAAIDGVPLAHAAEHAVLTATALAFWTPVLATGPVPRRLGDPERVIYLFGAVPAIDLAAVALMAAGQQAAGVAMLTGMLPVGLAAVLVTWRWIAREQHGAELRERREAREAWGDAR